MLRKAGTSRLEKRIFDELFGRGNRKKSAAKEELSRGESPAPRERAFYFLRFCV